MIRAIISSFVWLFGIRAFIISFTSDFIPKLVYQIVYNHDELYGYVNNSLSYFDISSADYKLNNIVTGNITTCRFRDYRQPPCTVSKSEDCNYNYDLTIQWWVVLAFRLAFIIIFEHVVSAIKSFVAFIIPDIPSKIFIQLQRQKFLSRQARLLDLSGNNEIQSKFSGNIISSDIGTKIKERNIAFQPDLFGTNDQTISQPFKTVMRHESLRNITASLRSTSADSFCSCYDDRTEKDLKGFNLFAFILVQKFWKSSMSIKIYQRRLSPHSHCLNSHRLNLQYSYICCQCRLLYANRQRLIRRNYYWYITQKAERIKKRQKLMSVDRLAPLDAICVILFQTASCDEIRQALINYDQSVHHPEKLI
ncbi:unnamed protein product [Dracunculus medinensis]|uniref:Anoctamin n=1 Tax=Dracunculus medinensis TaxID=318479 RepID=A0A0N4UN57_DRAME|nr:unnamed protein product [Dracunculus medinensis]